MIAKIKTLKILFAQYFSTLFLLMYQFSKENTQNGNKTVKTTNVYILWVQSNKRNREIEITILENFTYVYFFEIDNKERKNKGKKHKKGPLVESDQKV